VTLSPISLLVSDVDGTLVTPDKTLTAATIAAAQALAKAGIKFTIVSSRPPRGMTHLIAPLALTGPLGAFNGGVIFTADLTPVAERYVDPEAGRIAIESFRKKGVETWLFDDRSWFITDPNGHYVAHERHTVGFDPTVVDTFDPLLGRIGKIVGASQDFALLARIEGELQPAIGARANARRSQNYYLDITALGADKGDAVVSFAKIFGVPLGEIAVIGDMANDVPMFKKAALAIAMGNATDAVKAEAQEVTAANTADGWATAVTRFVLPRARAVAAP
jgi:Cof subfamily protein (haloacid dehalogenase superfamily)